MTETTASVFLYLCTLKASKDSLPTSGGGSVPHFSIPPKWRWAPATHWALCVRETCYDLTSIDTPPGHEAEFSIKVTPLAEWEQRRANLSLKVSKPYKVGATVWTNAQIKAESADLYGSRFKSRYDLTEGNCQNFVRVLRKRICLSKNDTRIPPNESGSWRMMPPSASQATQAVKKVAPFITTAIAAAIIETKLGIDVLDNPVMALPILAIAYLPLYFAKSKDTKFHRDHNRIDSVLIDRASNGSQTSLSSTPSEISFASSPSGKSWSAASSTVTLLEVEDDDDESDPESYRPPLPPRRNNVESEPKPPPLPPRRHCTELEAPKPPLPPRRPAPTVTDNRYAVVAWTTTKEDNGQRRFWCSDFDCACSSNKSHGFLSIEACETHIRISHHEEPSKDPRWRTMYSIDNGGASIECLMPELEHKPARRPGVVRRLVDKTDEVVDLVNCAYDKACGKVEEMNLGS